MIALDVTERGETLTLEKLAELLDDSTTSLPGPGVRLVYLPDELWVTEWQYDNIFSSAGGKWKYFRGIPIKVKP